MAKEWTAAMAPLFLLGLLTAHFLLPAAGQKSLQSILEPMPTGHPHLLLHNHNSDLQHSLLNKFLYQLHQDNHQPKAEDSDQQQQGTASLLLPLHQSIGIRPPFTGLPPSLLASSSSGDNSNRGLLLPTPAQLPATFRLPATAMAQHKAFPAAAPSAHPFLLFSPIVEPLTRPLAADGTLLALNNLPGNNNGTVMEMMVLKEEKKDDQQKEEPEIKEEKGANERVKTALIIEEKSGKVGQTIELSTDEPTSANTTAIIESTSSAPSNIGNFTSSTTMKLEVETTSSSSPSSSITPTPNDAADGTNNGTVASAGKEEASNVGEAKEEPPHTDLETFLRSANLSSQHTAQFMRLLETEVARRLESHLTKEGGQQANNSSAAAATLSDSRRQQPQQLVLVELPADELLRRREQSQQQNAGQPQTAGSSPEEALEDSNSRLAAAGSSSRTARLELKTVNTRLFSLASGEGPEAGMTAAEKRPTSRVDELSYRQREQAEFDRLLSQLAEETTRAAAGGGGNAAEGSTTNAGPSRPAAAPEVDKKTAARIPKESGEDGDLLLVVSPSSDQRGNTKKPHWSTGNETTIAAANLDAQSTTSAATSSAGTGGATTLRPSAQQQEEQSGLALNRQHRFWSRHGPKNKFERLVEDYRFRLSGQDGQNGLNDLIKALRNSHIGFFDRMASPTSVKILRRIER